MLRGWRALRALGLATLAGSPFLTGTGCSQSGIVNPSGITARSACEAPMLKASDLSGILTAPIVRASPVPGDAQSCEFFTASFPAITVSLRAGLGRSSLDAWASGRMPLHAEPLAGVGDQAVWQESLHEVIARKEDLLCDIQVRGGGGDIALAADALPRAVGALCNRIFAASLS
jgi:hypothetical protein